MKVLALDLDGVLTDGSVYIGAGGRESKRVHYRDADAATRYRRQGGRIAIITGESSDLVDHIAAWIKSDWLIKGMKDKAKGLTQLAEMCGVPVSEICYVGDSDRDAPALRLAGLALVPRDATREAKSAAMQVLGSAGGAGCVAEAVEVLLDRGGASRATYVSRRANKLGNANIVGGEEEEGPRSRAMATFQQNIATLEKVSLLFSEDIRRSACAIADSIASGGKVILVGIGRSAITAEYFAAELGRRLTAKSGSPPAFALRMDVTESVRVGNQCTTSDDFKNQIEALAKQGDILFVIHDNGHPRSVLKSVQLAMTMKIKTIAMTGGDPGEVRELVPICIAVPHTTVPYIQAYQMVITNSICEIVEDLVLSA